MKLIRKKVDFTSIKFFIIFEIILFLFFLIPIAVISAKYNIKYLNTYLLGFTFDIIGLLILWLSVKKVIIFRNVSSKKRKKIGFWTWYLFFILRMLFYLVGIIIVAVIPNHFIFLIIFIPYSFKTLSVFLSSFLSINREISTEKAKRKNNS